MEPITLEGQHVRLEPLTFAHLDDLSQVAFDPDLWRWTGERAGSPGELRAYVERALDAQRSGSVLPFATIARSAGKAVGSTRLANFDRGNRRVEIGWTWLGREWQRTAEHRSQVPHAEPDWAAAVAARPAAGNFETRADLRLGAKEEGVQRKHAVTSTGRVRDTVYYSILEDEWPEVKARLEKRLKREDSSAITALRTTG